MSRMDAALREAAAGADAIWQSRIEACNKVRESAAHLLGAEHTHEVAFVPNTSSGLSYVAEGVDWRQGDNVVGAKGEFPTNIYPWLGLADRGVEFRRVSPRAGRLSLADIAAAIDERTRVVALSWVQYANGFRIDLAAVSRLCRAYDSLFVVDAIQGLGALPFSVVESGVDVCVAAAHKWLLGPEGIGLLYVSDRVLDQLRLAVRGWLSVEDVFGPVSDPPRYRPDATRYECGTRNIAGIYGLGASIDWLLEIGIERVASRVLALARRVELGLVSQRFVLAAERAPGEESGIVAATHPSVPSKLLCEQLATRDIQVAHRADHLRVSPHFYNTEDEIDECLSALAGLVS